jgi:hypothetical protein
MAATVPHKRTNPRYQEIQIGAPVRARTWRDAAHLMHWVRAHGQQIVPAHSPHLEISYPGAFALNYLIKPPGLAVARVWFAVLRGTAPVSTTNALVTVAFPDTLGFYTTPFTALDVFQTLPGVMHVEELPAKSSALATITVTLQNPGAASTAWIESIECWELPRALLTQDSTDYGVDVETLRPGQPIYEYPNRSLHAIAVGAAATEPRRVLAELAFPIVTIASGTPTDIFETTAPILPRKGGRTATTRLVTWGVCCWVSNGTTNASVRITTTSGDVRTANVLGGSGGTTVAFRGGNLGGGNRAIASCEDLSTADGLPGGTWEGFQIAAWVTAGAGTVSLNAVAVLEED